MNPTEPVPNPENSDSSANTDAWCCDDQGKRKYKTRIRPEMVSKGKQLAEDPRYPDEKVLVALAEKLAPQFRKKV